MAKNANKILKEIAIKMGGNVGEKDNDTNELLASIATSLGATPDGKKNSNELLELISENVSAGGGGAVLPLGQTNPDCYYYKTFFKDNATLTIDFNKFADWYEHLINTGYDDEAFTDWTSDDYSYIGNYGGGYGMIFPVMIHFVPYNGYAEEFLRVIISRGFDDDNTPYIALLFNSSNFNNELYDSPICIFKSDDRPIIEYIRQFGTITTNLADWRYSGSGSPIGRSACYIDWIYNYEFNSDNFGPYENHIELINSIDWLKISENN